MKTFSLVIVDDNVEFLKMLERQSAKNPEINTLCTAFNSSEGLALIKNNMPDALLADLVMPGPDGFHLLDEVNKLDGKKPIIVIMSGMNSPAVISMASKLGADHFVTKPLCIESLFETIAKLCKNRHATPTMGKPSVVDLFIQSIMDPLPVNQRLMGYRFLQTAVKLTIEDPGVLDAITKILYPMVAKKHKSSGTRVERAIRHMIGIAWDNDPRLCQRLLAVQSRPTNGQLIAAIADRFKIFEVESVEKSREVIV